MKTKILFIGGLLLFSAVLFAQTTKSSPAQQKKPATTKTTKTTTKSSQPAKSTTTKVQPAKPATTMPAAAAPKPAPKVVIAVGEKTGGGAKGVIIRSVDKGNTWKRVYENFQAGVNGVTYGGGKWVAVCNGKALISPSGEEDTWEEADISGVCPGSPRAVAFGDGFYLAVGEKGTFCYSKDAKKWTQINDVGGMQTSIAEYYNVKFAQGKFIVAGNYNRVVTAMVQGDKVVVDKIFKNSENVKDYLSCIAVGNKIFVCNKAFFKSIDAKSFNQYTPSPEIVLQGIGWGNGLLIGANPGGGLFYSEDGVKWNIVPAIGNNTPLAPVFRDIVYVQDTFIAAGDKGNIWTSADGKNWKKISTEDDYSSVTFLTVAVN